ncbi:uncharacterized protein LOC132705965 isoform X2 [Cylas formicarius]|uniref:uncharacterized protein LOC132705965 isoform X2 n=1 Tax=Cylas formicarius TaxID=197179 RepID=UPI00295875BE|nr:uncharacterized protein LOC132705965 isoform X2 [Cylas formicarius]
MLATMATVTSGILSPNSYVLNADAVALKLSHQEAMDSYHHRHAYQQEPQTGFGSNANSSDSEQEVPYTPSSPKTHASEPKRNKRKNFKPRCSQNVPSEEEVHSGDYHENNNVNNNVRRRKALVGPRRLVVESAYSPMDLSGSRTQDSESQRSDNSDSDDFNTDNYRTRSDNEEEEEEEEPSKIPTSFSIHNLSKPHVSDQGLSQNLSPDQIAEMRNYAVNTMRELLGIYGLTSEVAESISRQLPLAAFSTGKIFENLTLNPQKATTPLSEPPTPPSTPLSPKNDTPKGSTTFGNITITPSSQPTGPKLPQGQPQTSGGSPFGQNYPLNLDAKRSSPLYSPFSNGFDATPSGGEQSEFSYPDQEGYRNKGGDNADPKGVLSSRAIFPGNAFQFSHHRKTDSASPPPLEPSPLNAMMQQSMSTHHLQQARDPATSSANMALAKTSQMDYSKYVKKFTSSVDCGSAYCKDLNYREHFHCLDCNSRVFIKKEEMIRHFKWHKKRDESLQHGFMRYSPLDDCGDRFANCTHNKKQTHYHCIQENCDKVYISTSDVQMHSNYHRKDSAIMQEGFQRYRATEECGASYCAFFGQRTTHFHCRRSGCRYTFKNKSDMEKHKTYHIKDEQLSRDGFKKFMKNETCPFDNCRFSKVCNHIHCIRPQCSYVLHSSGQLFSHKRKHERKDSELAYRKYKLAQSMMRTLSDGSLATQLPPYRDYEAQIDLANFYNSQQQGGGGISNASNTESLSDRNSPLSYNEESEAMDLSASETSNFATAQEEIEDTWKKFCHVVREGRCKESCEYSYQDHFHCAARNCRVAFATRDGAREHSRNHEQQETITDNFFHTVDETDPCDESCAYQNKEKHYHCNLDNCREVIPASDKPFRRLEHYKMHQYSQKLSLTKDPLTSTHLATSIDGMFCRKRGRPPKNRVIEVWNDYNPAMGSQSLMDSPQAIFTSFKLPKPSTTPSGPAEDDDDEEEEEVGSKQQGFDCYGENTKCPDNLCRYLGTSHYHCNRCRCLFVTDKEEYLALHAKDFHENVDILDGFEFYDRNVDCRLPGCASNKINRHFHCTRCRYSFVQYSQMASHNQKHIDDAAAAPLGYQAIIRVKSEDVLVDKDEGNRQADPAAKVSVVRASGTFYPISTIPTEQTCSRRTPDQKIHVITTDQPSTSIPDQSAAASTTLYGPELSCRRPFCKLKRKPHYHCNACNQAFSELDKLLPHVARHSSGALHPVPGVEDNNNAGEEPPEPPEPGQQQKISVAPLHNLQNPLQTDKSPKEQQQETYFTPTFDAYNHFGNFPSNFATQIALMQQQNAFLPQGLYPQSIPSQIMFQHAQLMQSPLLTHQNHGFQSENLTSPLAAMAANLNKRSLSPHEMSPEAKKARIQNSMRILKDEPVPAGYLRFRFNEDCKYQHCGYREHQTHFHCQRPDCGYSFCDKTRFVQHTARHERLDTLMGGDFQQYRANVACGRQDCAYTANLGSTQNKASHFHCLKCEFVCTDTNKVVAHRRQHQKLDSIQAAGFEKFTPSQMCRVQNCQHGGKQTHYHCLSCQYAVLGLAQMSAHKYRHMDG